MRMIGACLSMHRCRMLMSIRHRLYSDFICVVTLGFGRPFSSSPLCGCNGISGTMYVLPTMASPALMFL